MLYSNMLKHLSTSLDLNELLFLFAYAELNQFGADRPILFLLFCCNFLEGFVEKCFKKSLIELYACSSEIQDLNDFLL